MNISKILVPFDNNVRSIKALEYAAMIASAFGAGITALHLADPKDFKSKADFQKSLQSIVDQQLRPELKAIQKDFPNIKKIDLQVLGKSHALDRHILDFASKNDTDLIVMRSHGQSKTDSWEPFIKDTNAYKVVLEADCPVFTFTQYLATRQISNILLPLDMSEGSTYKVSFAVHIAKLFNARVHLLSSSEEKEEAASLGSQLQEVANQISKAGCQVITSTVGKEPLREAVLTYIEEGKVDLLMLMTRPTFRWSDLWISPTAKNLLANSKVPIINIRSLSPIDVEI